MKPAYELMLLRKYPTIAEEDARIQELQRIASHGFLLTEIEKHELFSLTGQREYQLRLAAEKGVQQ